MTPARRRDRGDAGAVAIIVVVLSVTLFGILAFVTDFGMAYANKRTLQNGADAAALAAAQEVLERSSGVDDCPSMIATAPDANSIAADVFDANASVSGGNLAGGGVTMTCGDSRLPNRVVVTATGQQVSPGFFGGIFGAGDIDLTQSAKAVVGPAATIVGLRPFALCEAIADLARIPPTTVVTLDFSNEDLGCGTASGNFGTLNIAGGAGTVGVDVVRPWIQDGYPDPIPTVPPFTFQGRTGIPSINYASQFAAILDEPIVLPVYSSRTGTGANSTYTITGFVEVKLCGVRLNPSSLSTGACFEANAVTSGSGTRFLQLRFISFIPVGELNLTCPLLAVCDPGLRVVKLAD